MSAEQDTTKPVAAATPEAPAVAPAVGATEAPKEEPKEEPKETTKEPETTLDVFQRTLPEILKEVGHTEMWGVQLQDPSVHVPSKVIIQKFINANENDTEKAVKQFKAALTWRKENNPTALATAAYDETKFGGLGYVTTHSDDKGKDTVITWNIYGAVKNFKTTFGELDEFIKWRVALMELGIQKLKLNEITEALGSDSQDSYKMIQVHDYLNISFLRMDPNVRAASSKTIELFSMAYPELLSTKYFVNVPFVMSWMYAAMKFFMAPATQKKLQTLPHGSSLVNDMKPLEGSLPTEYGGKGASLEKQGIVPKTTGGKDVIPSQSPDAPVAAVSSSKAEEVKAEEAKKPAEEDPAPAYTATEEPKPVVEAPKAAEEPVVATQTDVAAAPVAAVSADEKPAETKAA